MVITHTSCLVDVSSHRHFTIEYNSDISSTGTGDDVAIANLDCSNVMFHHSDPHIIGITESWANKDITDAELGLEGYVMLHFRV